MAGKGGVKREMAGGREDKRMLKKWRKVPGGR